MGGKARRRRPPTRAERLARLRLAEAQGRAAVRMKLRGAPAHQAEKEWHEALRRSAHRHGPAWKPMGHPRED